MAAKRGLLIAFDGIDSSGKATHAQKLVERLRFSGRIVNLFATPDYTTATGQSIKKLLQNQRAWNRLPWQERMELFAANRAEHRMEVLAALQRDEIVVYDRYVPSSIAFFTVEALIPQAVEQGRDEVQAAIIRHEYGHNQMPHEDISIFLDVPVAVALTLLTHRKRRAGDQDEYSDEHMIQQRLYNEYDVLTSRYPEHYLRIRCVVGAELLRIEGIAELIWLGVISRFPRLKHP